MSNENEDVIARLTAQAKKLEDLAAHNKRSADSLKAEAAQQMEQYAKNSKEAAEIKARLPKPSKAKAG